MPVSDIESAEYETLKNLTEVIGPIGTGIDIIKFIYEFGKTSPIEQAINHLRQEESHPQPAPPGHEPSFVQDRQTTPEKMLLVALDDRLLGSALGQPPGVHRLGIGRSIATGVPTRARAWCDRASVVGAAGE